jgi:uncharacterized membrane protein YkvA (DUF1232 family)
VLLRGLLAAVAALAVTWAVFVAALALLRPRGIDLREAKRLVPDVARLVRGLAGDASLPRGVRRRLALLLAYLAFPIDLVPDVVPVLGYADDVVVIALVLRSVVRRAGPAAVERHWTGTPAGLAFVRSLAGIA